MTACGQTEIPHYFTIVHPRYSASPPAAIHQSLWGYKREYVRHSAMFGGTYRMR